MNRIIASIDDFQENAFSRTPYVWGFLAPIALAVFAALVFDSFLPEAAYASIIVILLCMLLSILALSKLGDNQEAEEADQRERYFEFLSSFSVSHLRQVRVSPEVDSSSKEAITQFLNRYHEGWSLKAFHDRSGVDRGPHHDFTL